MILQRAGKLLLHEKIHLNHVLCDRLKNGIKQLEGKIKEFHLVQNATSNTDERFDY